MLSKHDRILTPLVAFLAAVLFVAIGFWPADRKEPAPVATAGLRRHLQELRGALIEWGDLVDALPGASPGRQSEIMDFAVDFLKRHVLAESRAEENRLFPAVDRCGAPELRSFAIEEHRLLRTWTRELEALARDPAENAAAFRRRAHEIGGLLLGHLEVEERLLLPLLDRKMSPDRFRREVWSPMIPDIE